MRTHVYRSFAAAVSFAAFFQTAIAQNSSPYWSLAGNSNATSGSKLGTTSNVLLRFFVNNTERGRINTNGNWGIGDVGTDARLTVSSAAGVRGFRVRIGGDTKLSVSGNGGVSVGSLTQGPANGLYVVGNVGIGTATPSNKLHVVGRGQFDNGVSVFEGGIYTFCTSCSGVEGYGESASFGSGVYGSGYRGVYGSGSNYGVQGYSTNGYGGSFQSFNNYGLEARTTNGTYAGVFYGSIYTSGSLVTSDKNLKQNAQEFGDAMAIISRLKPRYYQFKTDGKYAFLNLPKGNHYGLMAQEVEEVLPSLVSASSHKIREVPKPDADGNLPKPSQQTASSEKEEIISIKALNYTELIPIMIKGMQEQAALIKQQQQQIDDLKEQVARLKGNSVTTITGGTLLGIATPNPATNGTRISYSLPSANSRAQLLLTDATGKTVKAMPVNGSGYINLDVTGFSSGIYNYSLLVDGKIIASKKMKIVRGK